MRRPRMVKSHRRRIIEVATHSVSSGQYDFGDSEIVAHPEIIDLEPNADTHSMAITARL